MFLFSDEFFWNNFTHPKDSLVDLEFLFQTLGITEFNFEVSGSLVMRPTESNSILFTTTNEPIIDTWCELALGNMIFHTRNNIYFLDWKSKDDNVSFVSKMVFFIPEI